MPELKIQNEDGRPELYLYDEIGPAWWGLIDAATVIEALDEIGPVPEIAIRINSPGGDVFEGVAIYNALARLQSKVVVYVDALAASIASVIAMAGDEIEVAGNGMLMIHRAWTMAWGNEEELTRVVESLKKVDGTIVATYDARVGDKATPDEIREWMAAETWMDADEAVARGFADRVGELKTDAAACIPAGRFKNTPKHLVGQKGNRRRAEDGDRKAATTGYMPEIAARIATVRERYR